MTFNNICKCGQLLKESKLNSHIIEFTENNSKPLIILDKNVSLEVNFCPFCGGKDILEWWIDYKKDIFNACACGIKTTIDSGRFNIFKVTKDIEYAIKSKKNYSNFSVEEKFEHLIFINSCFNCGNRLFDREKLNESLQNNNFDITEPSKIEIDDFFSKFRQIKSVDEAIEKFGNDYLFVDKNYLKDISEITEYDEILKSTLYFKNIYETVEVSLDFFFDGEIGYTIKQKL